MEDDKATLVLKKIYKVDEKKSILTKPSKGQVEENLSKLYTFISCC